MNVIRKIAALGMNCLPDKCFLQFKYRLKMGKRLNLKCPQTYTEKLQWLKLYDRQNIYTNLVDKYEAKKIIGRQIGKQYIIPTFGVWERFEDIDFDSLPSEFVLKPTHTSGNVYICRDKEQIDKNELRNLVNGWLTRKYYRLHREWPYKNVPPRIIAEKLMKDGEDTSSLKDYKFFCFHGVPKALFIASDRGTDTRFDFYDMDFCHLDIRNGHENAAKEIIKPDNFEEMKSLAAILSKGIPHVRVDFYSINGQVYFGELTFYHWSGFVKFEPPDWDRIFGDWLILPNSPIRQGDGNYE